MKKLSSIEISNNIMAKADAEGRLLTRAECREILDTSRAEGRRLTKEENDRISAYSSAASEARYNALSPEKKKAIDMAARGFFIKNSSPYLTDDELEDLRRSVYAGAVAISSKDL